MSADQEKIIREKVNMLFLVLSQFYNTELNIKINPDEIKLLLGHWLTYVLRISSSLDINDLKIINENIEISNRLNINYFTCHTTSDLAHKSQIIKIPNVINQINSSHHRSLHSHFIKKIFNIFQWRLFNILIVIQPKLLIQPYLGVLERLKLHIYTRTLPIILPCYQPRSSCDQLVRHKLKIYLRENSCLETSTISSSLISCFYPRIFLEDLKYTFHKIRASRKHYKYIYTANAFDECDIFKLLTLKVLRRNACYIVSQHGNNYQTLVYDTPTFEEETCTKFLSWFKMVKFSKYSQIGVNTRLLAGLPQFSDNSDSLSYTKCTSFPVLFIVPDILDARQTTQYRQINSRVKKRLDEIISLLIKYPNIHFSFRLRQNFISQNFDIVQRINKYANLSVSSYSQHADFINTKFVVFLYDSTGMYESLLVGKPFIVLSDKLESDYMPSFLDIIFKSGSLNTIFTFSESVFFNLLESLLISGKYSNKQLSAFTRLISILRLSRGNVKELAYTLEALV